MATPVSEIDIYEALRAKLGDSETRELISYVKATRTDLKEELKGDKSSLATKEDIALLKTEIEWGLKEQLKWLIVLLIGFSSLIVTIIKLL